MGSAHSAPVTPQPRPDVRLELLPAPAPTGAQVAVPTPETPTRRTRVTSNAPIEVWVGDVIAHTKLTPCSDDVLYAQAATIALAMPRVRWSDGLPHDFSEHRFIDVFRYIIAQPQFNPNAIVCRRDRNVPIMAAVAIAGPARLREFLDIHASVVDVNAMADGNTPLNNAVHHGQVKCVVMLLGMPSIDVTVADSAGRTALGDAYGARGLAMKSRRALLCLILSRSTAGINVVYHNATVLSQAVAAGDGDCVQLLLAHGAVVTDHCWGVIDFDATPATTIERLLASAEDSPAIGRAFARCCVGYDDCTDLRNSFRIHSVRAFLASGRVLADKPVDISDALAMSLLQNIGMDDVARLRARLPMTPALQAAFDVLLRQIQ